MTRQKIEALIKEFNTQVGNTGWTSSRAEYDLALVDALKETEIDISAIFDGKSISFKNKIALNEEGTKIVFVE